ncbi:hypothetical protein [Anaerosinus sp.]
MKNTLGDLNNHLFAQIERLGDEELKGDQLAEEIKRSQAITGIAEQIISNGALVLKAKCAYDDNLSADKSDRPKMLEG